jgi:hypothetical protein
MHRCLGVEHLSPIGYPSLLGCTCICGRVDVDQSDWTCGVGYDPRVANETGSPNIDKS